MSNRFLRLFAASGLFVVGLMSHQSARAGFVTFSAATGGSAMAGQSYANFDNRILGNTNQTTNTGLSVAFSPGSNGAFVQGSSSGQYAAPILSGGNDTFFATAANPAYTGADVTTYVSTGTGSATLSFANGVSTYLGILWGSIDSYNSLTFNFTDGTSQTVSGSQVNAQLGTNPTGTAYVNFLGSAFSSVVATSTANSFEFDNVAFSSVPEPSSMALCGVAGLVGLGVARARRRRAIA